MFVVGGSSVDVFEGGEEGGEIGAARGAFACVGVGGGDVVFDWGGGGLAGWWGMSEMPGGEEGGGGAMGKAYCCKSRPCWRGMWRKWVRAESEGQEWL